MTFRCELCVRGSCNGCCCRVRFIGKGSIAASVLSVFCQSAVKEKGWFLKRRYANNIVMIRTRTIPPRVTPTAVADDMVRSLGVTDKGWDGEFEVGVEISDNDSVDLGF